jgi:hypothetical protein
MTSSVQAGAEWRSSPWRYLMWGTAGALLLAAAVAY